MKSTKRTNILIIVFLIVLLAGLAIAAWYSPLFDSYRTPSASLIDIPEVQTKVYSYSDGSEYMISAFFTLELDDVDRKKIDARELHGKITEIVGELDYDQLTSEGNMQYIKGTVKDGLNEYVQGEVIANVYIRDMLNGSEYIITNNTGQGGSSTSGSYQDFLNAFGR